MGRTRTLCLSAVLAFLAGCATPPPTTGPGSAAEISTPAAAEAALKNATGTYCPGLFCGLQGYEISGLALTPDGQSLQIFNASGTPTDTLPLATLKPHVESVFLMPILYFTSSGIPYLQTPDVTARRVVAAINLFQSRPVAQRIAPPAVASAASPAPSSSTPSPATLAPGAPATPASAPGAVAAGGPGAAAATPGDLASKQLAIKFLARCPTDPDPLGFGSDDVYRDCDADDLDMLHQALASTLRSKRFVAGIDGANADLTLTVTITQWMNSHAGGAIPVVGFLASLAPGTWKLAANYQLVTAAGETLQNGSLANESSDADDDEGDDAGKAFMVKLAAKIAGDR